MPRVIYIHGFNSSPQSHKARILTERMAHFGILGDLRVPELPADPEQAMALLQGCVEACGEIIPTLIGSSLGGYYAAWLAEKYDLKAILVNPAIYPYRLLEAYLGENENLYTGERYILKERHVAVMKSFQMEKINKPENYWLLLETGDEILDYRDAVKKFADSNKTIYQGGAHEFLNFESMLDDILRCCGYEPESFQ
ncbi:MAG: esterase [Gammaproteobacteria bacterium]|nr:esterase [Gammaproteobacteria bacterium]